MIRLFIEDKELDVNQDFSNQITYAVDDLENLDSKKTAFSKTIILPGTANNNKLLGNIFEIKNELATDNSGYNAGYNFNAARSAKIRLESNGLQIIKGILRVLQIIIDGSNIEYEVALFGELGGFVSKLGTQKLENLDFSEYDHTYSVSNIVNSWDYGTSVFNGYSVIFRTASNDIWFPLQVINFINIGDVLTITGTTYNNTSYTVTDIQQRFLQGTFIKVSETILHNETTLCNISINRDIGVGYYYPLIDYGNVSTDKHNYSVKAFRPAFYVREIIDKIITNAGYTYSSNFFGSDFFNRLIVPNNEKYFFTRSTFLFNANNFQIIDVEASDKDTIDYKFTGTPIYLGNFTTSDNAEFTWTAPTAQLNINFLSTLNMTVRSSFGNGLVKFAAQIYLIKENSAGQQILYTNSFTNNNKAAYHFTLNLNVNVSFLINQNDKLYWAFKADGWDYPGDRWWFDASFTNNFIINSPNAILTPIVYNGNVIMNDILPKNVLQKDFFTSIMKMFYLMITEDKFKSKHLIIEPYIDFYNLNPNTYLNWSDKVDRGEPIKIKPMSEINARYYSLKYKEDKDYINARYKTSYNKNYGDYVFDNNLEFAKDTQTTEIIFAPTPLVAYQDRPDDKITSNIMKVNNGVEDTTESIIRILQRKKITDVSSWNIYDTSGNLSTGLTKYGYAGHFDDPDVPNADLNFGVPAELYYTLVAGALGNNLFNAFYSSYLAEITDVNSKLFTCKMWLTENDIYNLDFGRFVWIDGTLFRLNKITDYTPNEKCTVDLLKVIYTTYSDVGFSNEFDSVTIDNQIWMQKNLDLGFFKNGDAITQAINSTDWVNACENNEPAWCYYNYDAANSEYGKLYNWYAVNDVRGLAPSGWRIPTTSDFDNLSDYLGGSSIAGKHLKESGTTHWSTNNGDNSSQFTSFGAGFTDDVGASAGLKLTTGYWTNEETSGLGVFYYIDDTEDYLINTQGSKCIGFSVRCIKN